MSLLDNQAQQAAAIWDNNPTLVQLLGLSPLLALSSRTSTALAIGLCTMLVCSASALSCHFINSWLDARWRYPAYCLLLAIFTTLIALLLELNFYPLWRELGVYTYLIAANFALLLRMDSYAQASSVFWVVKDSLKLGTGLLISLLIFGLLREWLFTGSVLSDWRILLPGSESLTPLQRQQDGELFRFSALQPAGFILLGLLIALLRQTGLLPDQKLELTNPHEVKRERVTGRLKRK